MRKTAIISIILGLFLILAFIGWKAYGILYLDNVASEELYVLKIPSGADYDDVLSILANDGVLIDEYGFDLIANKMNYPNNVHPGMYEIQPEMTSREIVYMLRQGQPLDFPIAIAEVSIQSVEDLAASISEKLEFDSISLVELLTDQDYLDSIGYSEQTILCAIIPNTYNFYYTTNAREFMARMLREREVFWDEERRSKAGEKGLTSNEVITLASIIEKEYKHAEELPVMAGVYLNRLETAPFLLGADPTVKFAVGDPTIRRVLNVHKEVDSPYNTYKYPGLPPGPICLPSITSIDAVLNAQDHDYFYFCARPDDSGLHAFASSYNEHLQNAAAYHDYLNKLGIYN